MEVGDDKSVFSWKLFISIPGITGIVVALIGLVLAVLGVKLVTLGGSWYYVIAGLGLIASGVLIAIRRRVGLWLYGLVLFGTVIWAYAEVGLDGWKLMPRLFAPAILGFWICLPFVCGPLGKTPEEQRIIKRNGWLGALGCALLATCVIGLGYHTSDMRYVHDADAPDAGAAATNPLVADGDWRYYGRTADGDRFSPLTQITPDNVSKLKLAWEFHTGDLPSKEEMAKGREFNFEDTPTKIGNTLFVCTGHHKVFSINATTGEKNWEFDPQTDQSANIFHACRGVAYYQAPANTVCPNRIITTTGTAKMVALDADTGKPCENFGDHGYVSLTDKMGDVPPGFHFITSQPLVINDRIILGGWIYDNQTTGEPSGVVRAYDPNTGTLAWAWDLGRSDPTAPLKEGEEYTRGTPNAWGTYTADPALGLVYLPMGNATPDYYGAKRRPFDESYSSSIVALDIATGKERWHFQTVHHDLWDFDLPIGPSLVDVKTPQGVVPALVQTTKRGEYFLLDRRDGHSLTAITEKPVPQNPLPGDHLSATQPYPDFPSLSPAALTEADSWGATPIDQLVCRIQFHETRFDGQFTPPTLGHYFGYPAFDGVTDWYGASIDPTRGLLITNTNYVPMRMNVLPIEEATKQGLVTPWKGWGSGQAFPKLISVANNPQYGTPYSIVIEPWLNMLDVPCFAPPWGTLTAIDLNSRKIVWQRPLGTTGGMGPFHTHAMVALPTGIFTMGGSITTAGGLVFIAGTTDDRLRAFDEKTGKELWETHLPAGGNATPMTYTGGDGKQYVAIAAGGHGALMTKRGDSILAYTLSQ
jgi:quinoprotein glucose dehydrogenase